MLKDSDPDMREMAQERIQEAKAAITALEDIQVLMLPKDPKDDNNVFLECVLVRVVMKRLFLPGFIPHVQSLCRNAKVACRSRQRQ